MLTSLIFENVDDTSGVPKIPKVIERKESVKADEGRKRKRSDGTSFLLVAFCFSSCTCQYTRGLFTAYILRCAAETSFVAKVMILREKSLKFKMEAFCGSLRYLASQQWYFLSSKYPLVHRSTWTLVFLGHFHAVKVENISVSVVFAHSGEKRLVCCMCGSQFYHVVGMTGDVA